MFLLYTRIRNLNLPVDCQFKLFDQTILPILLYGCEIWGFENYDLIESVHVEFLRRVLHLKKSTPLYMVYGESGRFPLSVIIKNRIMNFWSRLLTGKSSKLSFKLYNCLLNEFITFHTENKWITCVKQILNETGFSYLWTSQIVQNFNNNNNNKLFAMKIQQRLKDQYLQQWHSLVFDSPKSVFYRIIKEDFCLEPYLKLLLSKHRVQLAKFRTTNHRLPIETGRWQKIDRSNRICTYVITIL